MTSSTRSLVNGFLVILLAVLLVSCAGAQRQGEAGGDTGGTKKKRKGGGVNKDVEVVVDNRYTVTAENGDKVGVPMIANPIDRGSPDIQRMLILVPAVGRQIQGKHVRVSRMARDAGAIDTTLIIGLQFLYAKDLNDHGLENEVLYWDPHGWSQGDKSGMDPGKPRPIQISSFAIVDSLIVQAIDEFPNLNTIIVTGQSAGSKFTQRYAAGTRMPETYPDHHFGFISTNGGTFLYMNDERPKPGTLDQWITPTVEQCTYFSHYPLGLNHLNEYMERVGAQSIRDTYATRNYVYMIGTMDIKLDHDACAYQLQGRNRYDRNRAYSNYLQRYYGPEITQHQHFHEIEGANHNVPLLDTPIGQHYLFRWVPGDPSTYEM